MNVPDLPSGAPASRPVRVAPPSTGLVWLVEDSALEAEMATRVLTTRYTVEVFPDGPAMLERLSTAGPPDLLILDWRLPGMSGIEVCRFLRSSLDEMALPILMLTVQGHKPDIVEGLSAGANDYVTKPYDAAELLARASALGRTRRLYDELRLERRRLQHLFCSLPACIVTSHGPKHVVSFANPALLSSWTADDPIGKPVREAFRGVAPAALGLWDEAFASGEIRHVPDLPVKRAGTEELAYYNLSLVPQRSGSGQVTGVLAFAIDVTVEVEARRKEVLALEERQRLLDETRRAWARAEQANRAKDEFLATVSHELRTPLNAITGWTHLLQRGTAPESRRQHALDTIERNARVQTQLIDDLLDVSRVISGKLALEISPVDFVSIAEMAIDAVRPSAEAKNVGLVQRFPEQAPLIGDRGRLQQVVSNLLVNAVKFTPAGGRVELSLTAREGEFELTVTDTGQGVEPALLPHIFDRFRQGDSTTTRTHGGLGLGLAIVRHLVEAHGGRVSAESAGAGAGATFRVTLPSAAVRAAWVEPGVLAAPEVPAAELGQGAELRGRRVLVVEDDADGLELLARMLEEWGVSVQCATSAPEALCAFEAQPPDLLISDIGLPSEDGLSLIRSVRSLPRERGGSVPAIALSAYTRSEDREAALGAGFDAHLAKPFDGNELFGTLSRLV